MTGILDKAKYIALTTYRSTGSPVTTPVWFTESGGRYYVMTDPTTGKVKRLRHNPKIQLAACNSRGRVDTATAMYDGTGRLLQGAESDEAVAMVQARYGLTAKITDLIAKIRRKHTGSRIGIEIQLDPSQEGVLRGS